ncbi:MAG: TetR/AcrR family transcriptional regulator [Candidatus Marinimicrobia bacterium]|nr:TetR/AcrR family transcriptional regulator [Candidatus Neomarinimicrobiota bacterium]
MRINLNYTDQSVYFMNEKLKDLRKSQIMEAAQSVVVKKGYGQSRMDDIVKEAKLSKGAIYWYYKSKKEIYLSLVDHWFNEYSEGVLHNLENKKNASDQLKVLFDYFIDQFDQNPEIFKIMVEFWRMAGLDDDFNSKLQDVYSHFLKYIIDIIKKGIENGEFKKVDPRITALSIVVNIEGIHWFTLFDRSGVEAHEYIDTISDFILNGLKKKS